MVYDKFGREAVENYLEVQHSTPERVQAGLLMSLVLFLSLVCGDIYGCFY